jgi:bis(5'-adenosyl)-triphosphatase
MENNNRKPFEDCLFCSKRIIGKSFYSSPHFNAFYNIAPILPGHSLVVPTRHVESLFELTEQELAEMMLFARKTTQVLKSVFTCDGFDWTIQDGVSAGQTVPHLHLHIIPRKPQDLPEGLNWYSKIASSENQMLDSSLRERLNDQEYNTITELLRAASNTLLF